MKKVILTIIVFVTCLSSAIAEYDLLFVRTVPGKTNMRLLSVPFEGLNRYTANPTGNNRISWIFNGPIHRRFLNLTNYVEKPVLNFTSANSSSYLASCFSEVVSTGKDVYGFGKYLIEFENFNNTEKNISFIFNTLDSKAGRDSVLNGRSYHSDWSMIYYETENSAFVVIDNGDSSSYRYIDTVFLGQTNREINYWYAYWKEQAPLEKNFYVKTTPFPMNPYLISDTNKLYNIKIGTKIIFDTVYHNFGEQDRLGYNTVETNGPYDYYNSPPVPDFADSLRGNIFTTPKYFYYTNDPSGLTFGIKITAENSDTIILKKNKILYINGYDFHYGGDTLLLQQGSAIIKEEGAKLNACNSGTIIDEGCNSVWSSNSIQRIYKYSKLIYTGTSHLINNGGKVQIDSFATLSLAANTTLTFDGNNTNLELKPNSIVQLGENAKIEFKNGAYLSANGSAISSAQGSHGGGIVLENAGEQTSITNCTFTNLKNPIFVKNTDEGYYGAFKNISNNTFYTDASCNYVIETKNANNITISNNHIYMTQGKGVGILMRYYINEGNEEIPSTSYAVNVMGNEISNGVVSAAFISFTNSYPYINFKYNICYGNVSTTNLAYRQSHGIMKDNFIANNSGKNLDLIQAHPDVLSNSFSSYIMNLTNNDSYPIFAPVSNNSSDGGWIWRGGNNTLTSTSNGNIYYNNGNVLLDWGQNCFSKGSNYHLQGRINEPEPHIYYVRNNNFNGSNEPSTSLRYYYSDTTVVIPYYAGSNFACNTSDAGTIWSIEDLGNGFYDTLYRTDNNSGYQPDLDEGLYYSASVKKLNDDNYGAVSTFKTLINAYPQSSYTEACLYTLYECYLKLDTSGNQSTHDILYSDLKYFLDSKIASGLYSDEFNLNAYNITVMCLASISQYYEAMSGYEFIALYHPDEYLSFLASWDYAEIEDLMNGSGGISSKEESLTQEEYYQKLKKRIDRKINEDPVKKMVKKSFDRTKTAKISKIEKDAVSRTNSNETAKQEVARMKSKYEDAKMKAVSIMRTSKSLTREEKDRKQIEDLLLIKTEEKKESATFSNIVPNEYSISQNYPNPFNPNTKIKYALPKQGFVTLKIFDLTGREIQTLVNEFKQAGYYTVVFNGSNLSSGVYFYRIQSGNFVNVKRMVLVK